MATRKVGSRKFVVDGKAYRGRIRHRATDFPDLSPEGVPGPGSSEVGKFHRVLTRDSEGCCSMFRSILVPLDRSPFAERALTLALGIGASAGARLDLVTVHASYYLEEP